MHVDFGDQGINLLLFKQFKFQYLFILMDYIHGFVNLIVFKIRNGISFMWFVKLKMADG